MKQHYQAMNLGMQSMNIGQNKKHELKVSRYQKNVKKQSSNSDANIQRFAKEHNLDFVRAKNFLDMYGGDYNLASKGYNEIY